MTNKTHWPTVLRAGLIGATLWIDSQPRRGTTVHCLLPRAAPARKKKR